jgi:transposase
MLPQAIGRGSGMTCRRRLRDWQATGVWDRLPRVPRDLLGRADAIDGSRACVDSACVPATRGREDRRQSDRSRLRRVEAPPRHRRRGIPLAVRRGAASIPDSRLFEALIDAVPPIRHGAGRPRRRPAKLHTDKGCDFRQCRRALRRRSIQPRIARRGVDSSERLGCHRWVVERTLAWFSRFRRLTIRYERRADIFAAFHHLAAALICRRFVQRSWSAVLGHAVRHDRIERESQHCPSGVAGRVGLICNR